LVQAVFDGWTEASAMPPRYFCITSYARWPNFLFIRHLEPTTPAERCTPASTPVFVIGPVCPPALNGGEAAFVLVECALRVFQTYEGANKQQLPAVDGQIIPLRPRGD
jgi:hypothetical protein